jgi:hypothetical protein
MLEETAQAQTATASFPHTENPATQQLSKRGWLSQLQLARPQLLNCNAHANNNTCAH